MTAFAPPQPSRREHLVGKNNNELASKRMMNTPYNIVTWLTEPSRAAPAAIVVGSAAAASLVSMPQHLNCRWHAVNATKTTTTTTTNRVQTFARFGRCGAVKACGQRRRTPRSTGRLSAPSRPLATSSGGRCPAPSSPAPPPLSSPSSSTPRSGALSTRARSSARERLGWRERRMRSWLHSL